MQYKKSVSFCNSILDMVILIYHYHNTSLVAKVQGMQS